MIAEPSEPFVNPAAVRLIVGVAVLTRIVSVAFAVLLSESVT